MKVTQTHLRIAILSMGGLLILYGVVKMLWKVDFGPWIEANVPNGIFLGAAAIFVWNRSIQNKEKKLRDEEASKAKALEEEATEPVAEAVVAEQPKLEEPKKDL